MRDSFVDLHFADFVPDAIRIAISSRVFLGRARRYRVRLTCKPSFLNCYNNLDIDPRRELMWIFTKHGFYSAVCARQGDGSHGQRVDPDRIMVRCRLRGHLESLKNAFPELLADCEIHESSSTDYAYRIFVDKSVWSQVLVALNEEMNYDNFKSEVARHQGQAGAAYEHSLHDVWAVMNQLQREGEV